MLSVHEASLRGSALCLPVALLVPTQRVLTIRADDRIATWDAWWAGSRRGARPHPGRVQRHEGRLREGMCRACPQGVMLADPFHIIQDATARVDAARRLEQTLTKRPMR